MIATTVSDYYYGPCHHTEHCDHDHCHWRQINHDKEASFMSQFYNNAKNSIFKGFNLICKAYELS